MQSTVRLLPEHAGRSAGVGHRGNREAAGWTEDEPTGAVARGCQAAPDDNLPHQVLRRLFRRLYARPRLR